MTDDQTQNQKVQITYFNWMDEPRLFNQDLQDPTKLSSWWLLYFIPRSPACNLNPEELTILY